jgi:hypothetical protein
MKKFEIESNHTPCSSHGMLQFLSCRLKKISDTPEETGKPIYFIFLIFGISIA